MTSQAPSYHGYRFPPEIISHAVWLYHRFCLSFGDAEDLLAQQVSRSPMRRFGSGVWPSDRRMRESCGDGGGRWAIRGIWTNSS